MICSTVDSDQTYTVGLDVNEDPTGTNGPKAMFSTVTEQLVFMQNAILYTHPDGTRRIRIHNLCLPVTSRLIDIYQTIDGDTLATYYMKMTIDKIFKTKKISNSVLSTEAFYKTLISAVLSVQQSLKKELPDSLVYLPLYVLGILKHRVCCKDELERKFDVDLSNYMRIKIQKMTYSDVMAFIYPRIYPLHQLLYDKQLGNYDDDGIISMPQVRKINNWFQFYNYQICSTHYQALEYDGIYLIDNGFLLIIYTKANADVNLIRSLFGVDDISDINPPLFEDNVFNDPDEVKQRIVNMVDYLRGTKSLFQNLLFVFEGTDAERM